MADKDKQPNVGKSVMGFAIIAFILLGVLFGMNIMTFVFGTLGSAQTFNDASVNVVNESGWINGSGYTVLGASSNIFLGNVVVSQISNQTGVIAAGNYTVNITSGLIVNTTAVTFNPANITYSYNTKSEIRTNSENVNNNSLGAIDAYANQSTTQFTTLAISITLVVLLAVFAFFWFFFMGPRGAMTKSSGNFA